MKLLSLRLALLVGATGVLIAVPTVLLLGSRSAANPSSPRHGVAASDQSDVNPFRSHGLPLAQVPTPSATSTAASTPAAATPKPAATTLTHPTPAPTPRPTPRPAPPPPAAGLPNFSHVFVIVMENREYNAVIGDPGAPYINSLARSYGLATNYYGVSHPSLPNYLALTAGSTFGITSDCTGCFVSATNIADQVERSGRSWKAYMQDMPSACYLGSSYAGYAQKHDPFVYFTDIRNNAARCAAHVVPFTQFGADLNSGAVPNFVWITPSMCNDMHDCSTSQGDAWLSSVVPGILGSSAYRNNGVLFITWDEGDSSAGCCGDSYGGHVATVVISPLARNGFRSGVAENHYSLLRTIEDAWRLGHLGSSGCACSAQMREYFRAS